MDRPQIRKRMYSVLATTLEHDLQTEAAWVVELYTADSGDLDKTTAAARLRVQAEGRALVAQLRRKSTGSEQRERG